MDIFASLSLNPSFSLLFVLSFLAATILPIGSEWLLVLMITQGYSIENCVITASCGNYLGACTTFIIGLWGSDFFIERILRLNKQQLEKAEVIYGRFGSWSLLLSWLPIVGDPLCLVAGFFRTSFLKFSTLVFTGKFLRYGSLAFFTWQGMEHFGG